MFNKIWEWFWQNQADWFFYESNDKNHIENYCNCIDVKFKRGEYWKRQWLKLLFGKSVY